MIEFWFKANRGSPAPTSAPYPSDLSTNDSWMAPVAYVICDIQPDQPGRIHYLATDWNALSVNPSFIPTGTQVHPVRRQGNTWYVTANSDAPPQRVA